MWIYIKCLFISVIKSVFSASFLQSSVSHDLHNNILLKKHFWLLSVLKTDVLLHIFVETVIFSGLFDE